jgi:hypothetical protein
MKNRFFLGIAPLVLFSLTLANSVLAHPGHDLMDHGSAHVVTSPYHLACLALFGVLVFGAARFARQRLSQRLLQFAGVTVVLGAAIVWLAGL